MLSTGRLSFLLSIIIVSAQAQSFITGDNSSVADCSHECSHHDESSYCLDGNAHFYERIVMGQLRYYISTQVSIDLWHKNHKKGAARNASEIHEEVREGLGLQWNGETDIVTEKIIDGLADLLTERIEEINHRNRTHAPPTHCPIPCEYKNNLLIAGFILSCVANMLLLAAFVVLFTRHSDRKNHRLIATEEH